MHGAPVGGERLPTVTRERKPALAALAVLLILVGALGATVMVMRAGNKISVVKIDKNVAIGDPIPSSAIREVMVSDDSGVNFVLWKQRGDLEKNYRAGTNIVAGSVLVKEMITPQKDVLPAGKSLVGLSLKQGGFPYGITTGQRVAAYQVGNDAAKAQSGSSGDTSAGSGGDPNTLISDSLIIKSIKSDASGLGGGNTLITVIADSTVAGKLTLAASTNEVSLVLMPDSKN
ncbi:hypothetical protein SAMN05216251_108332 [Actinacidiphila alni]|uniref:SAF domain-containing protein n=1 Tax=Actinacidiphila alni TaxID=380248 RepID=A0A1I2G920_9ACTN|nr:hypothetical protein [Actinacidiphila alni]SFF13659.1 hypothetical protein SAMN05216251_108332 [Actinacidiphila alni]